MTDLPEAVQQTWREKFSDHAVELVEKLTRENGVTYEIQSTHRGKPAETVFDGNGKVMP